MPERPQTAARRVAVAATFSTALLLTAAARTPIAGDFDGDGLGDAAFYDAASSTFEIGFDIAAAGPEWHTFDLRRHAYFDGRFLRAADLDADGRTDLYTASYAANRVLVLWGDASRATGFTAETFTPGPGPAAADLVPGTDRLAVPLLASAAPTWHHFSPDGAPAASDWPLDPALAATAWLDFRASRESPGNIINGATLAAAIVAPGEFLALQKRPANTVGTSSGALSPALDRLAAFGFFGGAGKAPATVAFTPGGTELAVLHVTAAPGGGAPDIARTVHAVAPVADVRTVSTPAGDRLLVVAADGSAAVLYQIDGANLTAGQTLLPPGGGTFLTIAQGAGGDLVASVDGGARLAVYQDDGGTYALARTNAVPLPPAPGSGVQIVLFGAHPYGGGAALPVEALPAGDWASTPSLAGGTVSATLERLLDPLAGLGAPAPVSLDASVPLPAGTVPVANQWQSDTATAFAGGPAADGAAAVLVTPPGGRYASTVELRFLAAPGTTVHYRSGGGAWQNAAAAEAVAVSQSAVLEYFGSNGGALSAIRSAEYLITQDPGSDTDGDLVPDAVEQALGLSPFAGSDSDGDGSSDFSEIVQGTDPHNAADTPTEEVALYYNRIRATIAGVRPDGLSAPPAVGTEVFVRSLDGGLLAAGNTTQVAAPQVAFELAAAPRMVVVETAEVFPLSGLFFQLWPWGRRLSAVLEIQPAAPPSAPVDLASPTLAEDWRTAMNAALAAGDTAATYDVTLDFTSTLHALLFEAWPTKWKPADLDGKGTDVIDEPRPGVITLLTEDVIDAIEAPAPGGDRFSLPGVFSAIGTALAAPAAAPLRDAVRSAYATSAGSDPGADPPAPPLRTLRGFLADGSVPAAYAGDIQPAAALFTLAHSIIDAPAPDTAVDAIGLLELDGTDCLVLVAPGLPPARYELVDAAGLPFWQSEAAPFVHSSTAHLTGYLRPDIAPSCGKSVVEVVSLEVTDLPELPSPDADGDDLPDDIEALFAPGGGFWDDPDGDGYTTGEELYLDPANPTDPADGTAFPAGPPAFPANLEPAAGDYFVLEWDGNGAAAYSVECAVSLDGDWGPTGIAPVEGPPDHFTWTDPAPLADGERKFYRVAVELAP